MATPVVAADVAAAEDLAVVIKRHLRIHHRRRLQPMQLLREDLKAHLASPPPLVRIPASYGVTAPRRPAKKLEPAVLLAPAAQVLVDVQAVVAADSVAVAVAVAAGRNSRRA